MSNIPTPHIEAKAGDFAETVLMPGDPLRARFIAENFLTEEYRGIREHIREREFPSWPPVWGCRPWPSTLTNSLTFTT